MSNKLDETIVEKKNSANVSIWKKIGFFFSAIGMIIFICAFGYGYFQLSQVTIGLTQTVADLKTEVTNSQNALSTLQQSLATTQKAEQNQLAEATEAANQNQIIGDAVIRLLSLDKQIDQLSLITTDNQASVNPQASATLENAQTSSWQATMDKAWHGLQKIIVVRHLDQNTFIYQHLHAQVDAAMWGALHHNNDVYQASLMRANEWIQHYFSQEAIETKNILATLQELQKMTIPITAQ